MIFAQNRSLKRPWSKIGRPRPSTTVTPRRFRLTQLLGFQALLALLGQAPSRRSVGGAVVFRAHGGCSGVEIATSRPATSGFAVMRPKPVRNRSTSAKFQKPNLSSINFRMAH